MNNVGRLASRTPVLGWLIHDAINGLPDAKYYFAVNVLAVLALCVYVFGYPVLIVTALTATACALTFLIVLTAADLFSKASRQAHAESRRRG